jgi:predicted metallo-beta-lactamase superfamily hydrolase
MTRSDIRELAKNDSVLSMVIWQHDHYNLPWEEAMMMAVSTLATQKALLTEDLMATKNNTTSIVFGSRCEIHPSEG